MAVAASGDWNSRTSLSSSVAKPEDEGMTSDFDESVDDADEEVGAESQRADRSETVAAAGTGLIFLFLNRGSFQ